MSVERCEKHGHYDTDFITECPRCEERDYLTEARAILTGLSALLPERRHLEALDEAHEVHIIQLCNDLEALKRKALRI